MSRELQHSFELLLVQNSTRVSNAVLYTTAKSPRVCTTPRDWGLQRGCCLGIGQVVEMVFGAQPMTDSTATKLHVVPSTCAPASIVLSKLLLCTVQLPAPAAPTAPPAAPPRQRKLPLALVLLLHSHACTAPSKSKPASAEFAHAAMQMARDAIATQFAVLDLRICAAGERIRERVAAILTGQAAAPSDAKQRFGTRSSNSGGGGGGGQQALALQRDEVVGSVVDGLKVTLARLWCESALAKERLPLWQDVLLSEPVVLPHRRRGSAGTLEAARLVLCVTSLAHLDTTAAQNFVTAAVTATLCCHKGWVGSVSGTEISALQKRRAMAQDNAVFRNFLSKNTGEVQGGRLGGTLVRVVVHAKGDQRTRNGADCMLLLDLLGYFVRAPALLVNTVAEHSFAAQSTPQVPASSTKLAAAAAAAAATPPPPSPATEQARQAQEAVAAVAAAAAAASAEEEEAGSAGLTKEAMRRSMVSGDGVVLSVVYLPPEQQQFEQDLLRCNAGVRSTCGPAGSLVSMSTLSGFQPDLALLAVHCPYPALLDAISSELQFEAAAYGSELVAGDAPAAVVVDSENNLVDVVTLAPPEDTTAGVGFGNTGAAAATGKKAAAPQDSNKKAMLRRSTVFPSAHVADTLRTVRTMAQMKVSPDACVMYIEDRLHELFVSHQSTTRHLQKHFQTRTSTRINRISSARVMMEYLCVLRSVPSREQLEADLHLGPGDLYLVASLLQGSRRWPLA